jgi:hypothetical protein
MEQIDPPPPQVDKKPHDHVPLGASPTQKRQHCFGVNWIRSSVLKNKINKFKRFSFLFIAKVGIIHKKKM